MKIERNASIGPLTTFRLPARAAALVCWQTVNDLRQALADETLPRPFKAIGGGSNLLFTSDFPGTLLLQEAPLTEAYDPSVPVAASLPLDSFCRLAAEAGMRGPENLSGIPGTIGGALVQNAGAYGAEIGEFLVSARLFDMQTGDVLTVDPDWMDYAYRSSRLKNEADRYIIIDAILRPFGADTPARLDYGNLRAELGDAEPSPLAIREAVLRIRDSKLPRPEEIGSAGSFFRNPEVAPELLTPEMPRFMLPSGLAKVPAAWLIDRCGLKGHRAGGAMVWKSQPLVICNPEGNATATDVIALEQEIISAVSKRFNITLRPEVEHV